MSRCLVFFNYIRSVFFIKGANKSDYVRINYEIRSKEIRLIDENGAQLGLMSLMKD